MDCFKNERSTETTITASRDSLRTTKNTETLKTVSEAILNEHYANNLERWFNPSGRPTLARGGI